MGFGTMWRMAFVEPLGHQPYRQSYVAQSHGNTHQHHEAIAEEPPYWDPCKVKRDGYQSKGSQCARHHGEAVQKAVEQEDPTIYNKELREMCPPPCRADHHRKRLEKLIRAACLRVLLA